MITHLISSIVEALLHSVWLSFVVLVLINIIEYFYLKKLNHQSYDLILKTALMFLCTATILTFVFAYFGHHMHLVNNSILPDSIQSPINYVLMSLYSVGLFYQITKVYKEHKLLAQIQSQAIDYTDSTVISLIQSSATSLGIIKSVSIKLSASIQSAFVTACFNPLIIFPISWINALSPEETKAILLHELCHIANADLLWNRVLILVESIFFFNPAIKILIDKIKLQREIIADQFVIQQMNNRHEYASLLVNLESNRNICSIASLHFSSCNNEMTQRIHHLYNHRNSQFDFGKFNIITLMALSAICLVETKIPMMNIASIQQAEPCITSTNFCLPLEPKQTRIKKQNIFISKTKIKNVKPSKEYYHYQNNENEITYSYTIENNIDNTHAGQITVIDEHDILINITDGQNLFELFDSATAHVIMMIESKRAPTAESKRIIINDNSEIN